MVAPERRGFGYTVRHLHCPFPDLPPMVGFAKTVTMRAQDRVPLGEAGYMNKRLDYLDYVAARRSPSIAVIQDLDDIVGFGAFWGEVQTNIHKALGCLGTITNGSIRDIPQVAPGFQMLAGSIAPSHAFVHVVDFGSNVNIHGMAVKSGDLIHADQHGAVVVPLDDHRPDEGRAPTNSRAKEAKIIKAAKSGNGLEAIKAAMKGRHDLPKAGTGFRSGSCSIARRHSTSAQGAPSHRSCATLQNSRRVSPAVTRHMSIAFASAAFLSGPTPHPAPGVPGAGSLASATHWL